MLGIFSVLIHTENALVLASRIFIYKKPSKSSVLKLCEQVQTDRDVCYKRPQIDHKPSVFPCYYHLCTQPVIVRVWPLFEFWINAELIVVALFNGFSR